MLRKLALAAILVATPGLASASRVRESRHVSHAAPVKVKHVPTVELHHLSTGESYTLRPDAKGHLGSKQLRGLRHFLRCHHTGREHAMNPRLAQLLYSTSIHFGDKPITVVAGYRAPKVARKKGNPKSPHKRGVACDFRIAGVPNETLRDYLRSAYSGIGVGYYPNSGFIHLDVDRKHSAFWIDYSGPGERADYSRDPDGDLASGVVEMRRRHAPGEGVEPVEADEDEAPFDDDPGLAGQLVPPPPSY
jgi:uncharacterized protein YcbK (DUF882 family)